MNKNEEFIGVVSRVDFPNKSIVEVEGNKITFKNLLPGQVIKGAIMKKRHGKYSGRFIEVVQKAPYEIEPVCPVFGSCGGCLYQTMPYEEQLKLKASQVRTILEQVIGPLEERYKGIIPSPDIYQYRNKMEYSFGDSFMGGPLTLGMHKRGSMYDVAEATECAIVHPDFNRIVTWTIEYFTRLGIPFYHKKTHLGFLRFLIIRRGVKTNEIHINLVTSSQYNVDLQPWVTGLKAIEMDKDVTHSFVSIMHTINDNLADAVKSDKTMVLSGKDHFNETLLSLAFDISPFSFFQTNSNGAERLYDTVRQFVGDTKDKTVFDLYSGTGTITQLLAPIAKKAIGVEIIPEAVEAARKNAMLNGLTNCEFIAGDVLKVLDELTDKPDIIVLDPPREGIHPKALPKIIDYGVDKIIYVSCKPTSMAKDLQVFKSNGYIVSQIALVDLFPHTVHCESVCLLKSIK